LGLKFRERASPSLDGKTYSLGFTRTCWRFRAVMTGAKRWTSRVSPRFVAVPRHERQIEATLRFQ
jgi:hypothetical protein